MYYVINSARHTSSRIKRAKAPVRYRTKQYVCGVRLLPGEFLTFNEDRLKENAPLLKELVSRGFVEIRVGSPNGVHYRFDQGAVNEEQKSAEQPVVDEAQASPVVEPEPEPIEVAPTPPPEPVAEPEPIVAVDDEIEVAKEIVLPPRKTVDRMSKKELVAHVAMLTGRESEDLDQLTKRELMELVS